MEIVGREDINKIREIKFSISRWPSTRYSICASGSVLNFKSGLHDFCAISRDEQIDESFYSEVEKITKDWAEHYSEFVLDGECWSLEIVYDDDSKKVVDGINGYPGNYEELVSLFEKTAHVDLYGEEEDDEDCDSECDLKDDDYIVLGP